MSARLLAFAGLVVVSTVAPLAAQEPTPPAAPGGFCLRARPKPECAAFAVTTIGGFVMFGRSNGESSSMRGVLDYGFMFNTSARDAFGGSFFASLDGSGFALGPAVRYRRWLTTTSSLEVAVGKPFLGDEAQGAVFGLVKWSPNHWLAVAARPEIRRGVVCGTSTCAYKSQGRLSLGTEVGAAPGLVLTGVAGVGFAAFLVILLTAGGWGD
jgi:hypothetical protein